MITSVASLAVVLLVKYSDKSVYDAVIVRPASSELLLMIAFGFDVWRRFGPRPTPMLHLIVGIASAVGMIVTLACAAELVPIATYEIALDAYKLVALAIYFELVRAQLQRICAARLAQDLLPDMRVHRPRKGRYSSGVSRGAGVQ